MHGVANVKNGSGSGHMRQRPLPRRNQMGKLQGKAFWRAQQVLNRHPRQGAQEAATIGKASLFPQHARQERLNFWEGGPLSCVVRQASLRKVLCWGGTGGRALFRAAWQHLQRGWLRSTTCTSQCSRARLAAAAAAASAAVSLLVAACVAAPPMSLLLLTAAAARAWLHQMRIPCRRVGSR